MEELIASLKQELINIQSDIDKQTKAAEGRVRKATLNLEKLGKSYRKQSIAQHK